jgi:hypothetical protein
MDGNGASGDDRPAWVQTLLAGGHGRPWALGSGLSPLTIPQRSEPGARRSGPSARGSKTPMSVASSRVGGSHGTPARPDVPGPPAGSERSAGTGRPPIAPFRLAASPDRSDRGGDLCEARAGPPRRGHDTRGGLMTPQGPGPMSRSDFLTTEHAEKSRESGSNAASSFSCVPFC